jgi:hypothetical protein
MRTCDSCAEQILQRELHRVNNVLLCRKCRDKAAEQDAIDLEASDRSNANYLARFKSGDRGDRSPNSMNEAWAQSLYRDWISRMRSYRPLPDEFGDNQIAE